MSWEVVLLDSLKLLYILNLRYVPDIFQGSKNIIHINFLVFSQWNAGDYSYIQGVNSPFDSLHIRRKLEQFWGTYFLLFVKHANYTTKSFASNYQWLSVIAAIKQPSVNIYIRYLQKLLMWE